MLLSPLQGARAEGRATGKPAPLNPAAAAASPRFRGPRLAFSLGASFLDPPPPPPARLGERRKKAGAVAALPTAAPAFAEESLQCPGASQACSYPCQCPSQAALCPLGNSLLLDDCGCCRVCSWQLGELCSWQDPRDHHKGLHCDFSQTQKDSGICLAYEGSSCVLMGKSYLNGECFQPSCQLQCICMDGSIGCIPLCPDGARLPPPDYPFHHWVKVQNKCCEGWVCEGSHQKTPYEKGKRCLRNPKSHEAINFEFTGCTSVHPYWPKFCGSCIDNCCCTQRITSTVEVEFQCPEGESFVQKMMFIKSCSCHFDCPAENDVFLGSYHRSVVEDHFKLKNQ
ncbi:connective tissue growth factor-like [Pseudonaja textilis]|uniref:connective tissue growth factor-like n=1 Tax=Pseudonaja textilis TaxID=8673 RepID=UPI000EA9A7EF|nr:connective tissue growth factor-like [Pseudonaja textilis]